MIISHGAARWWRVMYCAAEPAHISLPLMQRQMSAVRVIGLWRFVFGYIPPASPYESEVGTLGGGTSVIVCFDGLRYI